METPMELQAFVLSIQLYRGAQILTFMVPSCQVGEMWYREALKWAERSHVPRGGPLFVCGRFDDRLDMPSITLVMR